MRNRQKGFTLIELMIVVAIIGILAAVAVPAYSDYTVRAKVTEAITAAGAAKTSVADYFYANRELPTSNTEAGLGSDYSTDLISKISVRDGSATNVAAGTIMIDFKEIQDVIPANSSLVFIPDTSGNNLSWTCSATTGGGDLPAEYAPANCRQASNDGT
ncbi:pilin [Spiribacter insolitus]|uniref:Pilin n=1 Tax=Spiribacter insolitus TaxID=3122417 RepID=A0ABV3TAV9_9GAMM